MSYLSMPICYFPSRVIFLCDREDVAFKQLATRMNQGLYSVSHSLHAATELLREVQSDVDLLTLQCSTQVAYAKTLAGLLEKDEFASLHAEVYNPCRFVELSVSVIDLTQPALEGMAFCQHAHSHAVKKLAIIRAEDKSWAEQALDLQLIHAYVIKEGDWVVELLPRIERLKKQYFLDMSNQITRLMPRPLPACLSDTRVAAFFATFCQTLHIVEYYLISAYGVFLLLDEQARVSFFLLGEAFNAGEALELRWNNELFPAIPLATDSAFIYAHHVPKPSDSAPLLADKVVSYSQFMQEWQQPLLSEC